jgi:hypothetical protein
MSVPQVAGFFVLQSEYGLQIWEKLFEVVLGARLDPDLLGQGALAAEPDDEIGRKLLGSAEIPPDLTEQRPG